MIASLIKPELSDSGRFKYVLDFWSRLAGGKKIGHDNSVFLSERNTAHTNFALAHLMMSKNAFPKGTDINRTLEFYFICCSLTADSDTLAMIAACLANGGINPFTGEKILSVKTVEHMLSLMNCCGMYDYSG